MRRARVGREIRESGHEKGKKRDKKTREKWKGKERERKYKQREREGWGEEENHRQAGLISRNKRFDNI